jgi:hypothetical protein
MKFLIKTSAVGISDKKFAQRGENAREISSKDYIEYILKNSTNMDKRQFLECLEGQLVLLNGSISLQDFVQIGKKN